MIPPSLDTRASRWTAKTLRRRRSCRESPSESESEEDGCSGRLQQAIRASPRRAGAFTSEREVPSLRPTRRMGVGSGRAAHELESSSGDARVVSLDVGNLVPRHVTQTETADVWWCTRPGSKGDQKLPAPISLALAGDHDGTTHDGRARVDSLPKELAPLLLQEEGGRVGYDNWCRLRPHQDAHGCCQRVVSTARQS
ncbi:unnamed protein product [Phytophthora lilii]|uniref:Unnamed protein product n=1 Tax=Phytophthora lilii TaxID=2077276 RepID=A0A9W7CW69_9STRA|nr:unnamed protein product [Phytophthora lilii]